MLHTRRTYRASFSFISNAYTRYVSDSLVSLAAAACQFAERFTWTFLLLISVCLETDRSQKPCFRRNSGFRIELIWANIEISKCMHLCCKMYQQYVWNGSFCFWFDVNWPPCKLQRGYAPRTTVRFSTPINSTRTFWSCLRKPASFKPWLMLWKFDDDV